MSDKRAQPLLIVGTGRRAYREYLTSTVDAAAAAPALCGGATKGRV